MRSLVVAGTVVAALAGGGAVVATGGDATGGGARRPSATGAGATGASVSGGSATGPTASGPISPGPTASGPTASGPTASGPTASGPTASARSSCATTVDATLRAVALRIYSEAGAGPNVVSATKRLARSAALARAVAHGSRAETRAALRPLLKSQIHRIVITRASRVLVRFGRAPALAPVRGFIRDAAGRPVGRYTLAVGDQAAIVGIIRALTGADVRIAAAGRPAPGGATASFAATTFPSRAMRVWLIGGAAPTCGPTNAATAAATIGAIAKRLYRVEASGAATHRALRHVSRDRRFAAAVAADDPVALRTAIVRFFRTRSLHIVRVRATTAAGRLVGDVGGPFVLAPASTDVRERTGRMIGRVMLSVQDDTGYMKLIRRFTGAGVIMRTARGAVPGSSSSPATAATFSFAVTAFPQGSLSVALFSPR